jgi:hypothetical protein
VIGPALALASALALVPDPLDLPDAPEAEALLEAVLRAGGDRRSAPPCDDRALPLDAGARDGGDDDGAPCGEDGDGTGAWLASPAAPGPGGDAGGEGDDDG